MTWIETTTTFQLDFNKLALAAKTGQALVPVVTQDAQTGQVLIVSYANEDALAYTLKHRIATYWSTSRNELWIKGATSGDFLEVVEVLVNCEQNALVYRVNPKGKGACHTQSEGQSRQSCFYRKISGDHLEWVDFR